MLTAISWRVTHWKSILTMPLAAIVSGTYAVLGALTWGRDELVRRSPGAAVWHVVDLLPHWSACRDHVHGAVLVSPSKKEPDDKDEQQQTAQPTADGGSAVVVASPAAK